MTKLLLSAGLCIALVGCSTLPETTVTKNTLGESVFGVPYDSKLATLAMSPDRRVFFVSTDSGGFTDRGGSVCAEPPSDVGVNLSTDFSINVTAKGSNQLTLEEKQELEAQIDTKIKDTLQNIKLFQRSQAISLFNAYSTSLCVDLMNKAIKGSELKVLKEAAFVRTADLLELEMKLLLEMDSSGTGGLAK
jgi:hypothetical protein